MINKIAQYCLAIFILMVNVCLAQPPSKSIQEIDGAIADKKLDHAEALLQTVINEYYKEGKADSLLNYIFYVGKVAYKKTNDAEGSVKKINLFINKIQTISKEPATMRQCQIEAGNFYGSIGLNNLAYKANESALKFTELMRGKNGAHLGLIENNLSTYAQRMGDLNLSLYHGRSALKHLLTEPNPDPQSLYTTYNGMGAAMWYASKTDSALYYFDKSLQALQKTPRTPENQYYRKAVLLNNLSALYQEKGKATEGINALKSTINNLKLFINSKEPHPKKTTAITFQFEATDNLAGMYKELGDLKKAEDLLQYSYGQKKKNLDENDPAIFISQILLGQLYFAMKDFERSQLLLNSGLTKIASSDGDYLFWQADACNTLALLFDAKKDVEQSTYYYEKADSLYEESLQGSYDNIYLGFLSNAALFYAQNGSASIANAKAKKGYNYVIQNQGAESLPAFYQLLNLSEVNFVSGKYHEALKYSKQGLEVVNKTIQSSNNLLDSIKIELKKPKAILLKNKAAYQLLTIKNVSTLSIILKELNEALALLERRKSVINDAEDIGLLMNDHSDLLQFVKKITYDLYKLTNDKTYIDRLLSLHESGIYNRIRSRLDKNDSIQFAHLPAGIQLTEKKLKAALTKAFDGEASHDEKMQRYFKAIENWNQYQNKIREEHPKYYTMRYASIFKSLGEIQKTIPSNTTLIRYFFINKELYALVADAKQKQLFALEKGVIEKQITALSQPGSNVLNTGNILYALHQQLWAPLAKSIQHKKIVIIPDGILYNLSFEILTPIKISSFKELATKSLLANYTISYHYSLFLFGQKNNTSPSKSFAGFAPGFSDEIKDNYRLASKDSIEMDMSYLSLLPQPFTTRLATATKQILGGVVFLNEQSTESSFKANAGNNKIIHLGTHAESNNIYPQFSRLIFAKDVTENNEDNSLYVDEIYNCNLTSNLTVLTACESGKPGYQDGEGMISLAHAFNYAGSQSILTGLWKIDEQASALLVDLFYKNLVKGMPKDEALRQAKLTYLQQTEGRMLAPQYWAGLVIMGDTSPIALEKKNAYTFWWVPGVVLVVVIAFAFYSYRKKRV